MRKKTQEEFIKELNDKNPDVFTYDNYVNATTKLKFHCKHNKDHIWMADPHHILHGRGCPYCGKIKIGDGVHRKRISNHPENLICNHNPELISCLKNKDDAYKYTYSSRKQIKWICPDCNFEFDHNIVDFAFKGRHFCCPLCLKNDSYPNRYMYSVLTQLNVEFIKEYSPDWIKPKRYDFYFEIFDKKYIVEMDGYFHSYNKYKDVDKYKDNLALNHNIEVIRINCIYSDSKNRSEYIKTNILKSKLNKILDLSSVDFEKCNIQAFEKIYLSVCKLWDKGLNINEICETLKISNTTAIKYLCFGEKQNICSYNHQKELNRNKIKKGIKSSISNGQAVQCIETDEVFSSMTMASKYYHCAVGEYFRFHRSYAGILPDGTKLTWKKISTQEYLQHNKSGASINEALFLLN